MTSLSRWLDVEVGTDDIDLSTLPANLALVDVQNDGEIKLLVGDFGRGVERPKLKIFRGAMQISDQILPDLPLGTIGYYSADTIPKPAPNIAIAFSSCICIYKNLKLFYKYYLPVVELSPAELDVWKHLINPENHTLEAIASLAETLEFIPVDILTPQSQTFLAMSFNQRLEYLEQMTHLPVKKVPEITCIASLKISSVDKQAASCLIVGTEEGDIILVDVQNFSILSQVKLSVDKRTPYQIVTTGLFSVDYKIIVATREKCVCLIKRSSKEGSILFTTDEHIIAIEVMPGDSSIIVICADNTMSSYSRKGKKQWCLTMEHRPVAMTLVPILHLGLTLTAVALASGHIHLYDGKAKRDTIFVRDVASVMKFGQLGQEEHVFIVITAGGNLMLKILKRTADFHDHATATENSVNAVVGKPWMIPKKSKLFLEQSARERDNAIAMHHAFQQELNRARLMAAKALVEAYSKSDNSVAVGAMEPVRLSAEVEGLGPVFRMTLIVENSSTEKAVIGLSILFHVHTSNYKVSNPYIKVPLLSPGCKIRFPTKIEEIFENNINPEVFFRTVTGQGGDRALVKVLLLKEGRGTPILGATVQMPPTDPMMIPYDRIQTQFGFENEGFKDEW